MTAAFIEFTSRSERQTMELAARLAQRLRPGDVVTLDGPLGSGKTCFVRGMARGLGLEPAAVSSPTFVIAQEYSSSTIALIHIDAYRLSGVEELESIGWRDMLVEPATIVAIEWASRIAAAVPPRRIALAFGHAGAHERTIGLEIPEPGAPRYAGLRPDEPLSPARCRVCGETAPPESPAFPFCSERCRLADLGRWFNERYRTSRAVEADEELQE